MGNNLPECGRRRASQKMSLGGDESPMDTEQYYNAEMPTQQFELRISNIRLKNVPLKQGSIVLQIEDIYQKTLKVQQFINGNARWEQEVKPFFFKANAYLLRKYFLKIVVLDETKSMVAQLKLNLYYIIMGPIQQDFPIELAGNKNKHKNCRIRLNVKISQCVSFQIKPSLVEVSLFNQHPGQAFHFSLKSTNYSGKEIETLDSYNVENALFHTRLSDNQKEEIDNRKRKNTVNRLDSKTHKLIWDQQKSIENYQASLPNLNIQILSHDLTIATFGFLLWRVPGTLGDETIDDQQQLFAQSQISFIKVSRDNVTIEQKNGIQYQIRQVTILEKIWYQGREIGNVKIECSVIAPRFYKQLTVCVRTEFGIQTNNPILEQQGISQSPEIKQLIRLKQVIQQKALTIRQFKNSPKGFDARILNQRRSLSEELTRLVQLLQQPKKKNSVIYTYGSQQDFFKGQIALLNVANKLFFLLGQQQISISQLCWRGLIAFMMRGQFLLSYMSTTNSSQPSFGSPKKNKNSDIDLKRTNLRLQYQQFLYKALGKVLQCLNLQAIPQSERTFAQLFCACSYFKIPQFRSILLNCIKKKDDPPVQLQYFEYKQEDNSLLSAVFDWQQNFYSSISDEEKYRQNMSDLMEILSDDGWKVRIQKRSGYFFYFIKYWIICIDNMGAVIPWNQIQGYDAILQAFVGQMYRRKISEYPDIMVEAAIKLLSNELLLGYFTKVLFTKTSIFYSEDILNCIEMMSKFFEALKERKKRIPASFDYKFFFSGIEKILSGTHCFVISKCIQMIYSFFDMFTPSFKNDISLFLLGKPFFGLFLNWAPIVRVNFHHFLVYKIQLSLEGNSILSDQIYMRYRLLKTVLLNTQKLKYDRQIILLSTSFDQNYFKSMKRKLLEKRRAKVEEKKVAIKPNSYKISQLSKAPLQRSLSDMDMKMPILPLSKQRRKNSYNPSEDDLQSQDLFSLPQKSKKRRPTYQQSSFALPQQIQFHLVQYIEVALTQFSQIQQQMKTNMNLYVKNPKNIPALKTKIPIDKAEIRPDTIDDW